MKNQQAVFSSVCLSTIKNLYRQAIKAWAGLGTVGFAGIALFFAVLGLVSPAAHAQTAGQAILTINGFDQCVNPAGNEQVICDTGRVNLSINNGGNYSATYSPDDSDERVFLAAALASQINQNDPFVTAQVNGFTLTLTAKTTGTNTNYPISTTTDFGVAGNLCEDSTGAEFPCFTQPSYTVALPGPTMTGGADAPIPGYLNLKYIILAWTYAPPGSKSTVVNNNSTMIGSSTANNDSFSNQVSESVSFSGSTGIFGKLDGVDVTGTESTSYTDEQDTSSSVSINQTKTFITTVPGPNSDSLGVNHDYDVVWLWLNPIADFNVFPNSPNSVAWTGYHYDTADLPKMDIFGVEMGWLNGHFGTVPADIQHVLDRTWAAGQIWPAGKGPGLTGPGPGSDFDNIVKANPFSDPNYTVILAPGEITTSDSRFTVTGNQNIQYVPPGPNGNPTTQAYSANYVQTDTKGKGAKYTFQQGFATEEKFEESLFLGDIIFDLKQSDTLTWTHQFSQTMTQANGNTVSFSVTGPAAAANYSGPTEFLVFQDNIFGTFMFYPVNEAADFLLSASPGTQSVPSGGNIAYTVSTTALRGFTGSVSFTVNGLPAGATATASPVSVTGTGTSTLTINVPSSVAAGNYPLTIVGTSGSLSHNAAVTLTVVAPDFSISATPTTQTVSAGGSAIYTVSTSALNGFTGSVSLGTSGLPTGATATFSPASISGTASSTLTINTSSSTPAATYTVTVTGISGSIVHSTAVLLAVTAGPTGSVTITSPTANSNQSTSVRVTGSATETGVQIGQMQIWDNGVKLGINNGSTIDQTFTLTPGTHQITVEDLAAGTFALLHKSIVTVTVFADGVHITAPTNNASITGPVHVTGFATESGSQIAQMQVWDSTTGIRLGINNGSTIDQTYTLAAGTHQLVMEDLAAGTFALLHQSTVTITVH